MDAPDAEVASKGVTHADHPSLRASAFPAEKNTTSGTRRSS